jgi:DNA-binding transcriptional ArsR family regulator
MLATNTVFAAIADPTRRDILALLRAGEQPVNTIAGHFRISRPAVSKHLAVLRRARLVVDRRDGRQRFCRLSAQPLRVVDDWLAVYRVEWTHRLGRLKAHAEAPSASPHSSKRKRS